MGVNKVEFGGDTLIDLTSDTVTPETLFKDVIAHDMAGNIITGIMEASSSGIDINKRSVYYANQNDASKVSGSNKLTYHFLDETENIVSYSDGVFITNTKCVLFFTSENDHSSPNVSTQNIYINDTLFESFQVKKEVYVTKIYSLNVGDSIYNIPSSSGWSCAALCFVKKNEGGIDVSDTTAAAEDVLDGKIFYDSDGIRTIGTLIPDGAEFVEVVTYNKTYSIDADDIFVIVTAGSGDSGYVNTYTIYTKNNVTNGNVTELNNQRVVIDSSSYYYGARTLNIKREDSSNPITFKTYNSNNVRAIVFKSIGEFTLPTEGDINLTSTEQKVTLGYKPSKITIMVGAGNTSYFGFAIHYSDGTVSGARTATNSSSATSPAVITFENDGFKIKSISSSYNKTCHYIVEK